MEEQTKDLSDYLDAFKRRRKSIILTAGIILVVGVLVAMLLPPTYRSTATILIEEQEVPSELVQSTVTSYASQRIQTISQRVMTRNNLMEIVDKYKLFTDKRERETTEEILGRMRDDIDLRMISADVVDPRTGRPTAATIAFSLSFNSEHPVSAQKVASELTNLYLEENLKERSTKAAETFTFLSDEANRINRQISQLEKQLAEFKEKHVNSLPELTQLNTQLMDRTERELTDVANQIRALEDRKFYLEGQLEQLEPHGQDVTMSPAARLKALRTQYMSLSSRYSENHPDVIRLKREIEGIEQETGLGRDRETILEQLDFARTRLGTLREKYAAEHPDVIKQQKLITSLEEELKRTPSDAAAKEMRAPDNPAYVSMQAQLQSTNSEIASLNKKEEDLKARLTEYEERLIETPQVQRQYRALNRDLNTALAKYQEIKAKEMQARVAQQLESESKGERFSLIEPAALPEEPIKPNRPAILFLSFVLAIGGGLGLAAIGESMDSSVRGMKGVANSLKVLPLAVIPYLELDSEKRQKNTRKTGIWLTAIVAILIVLLLIHFFWTPLDVLWFRVLRKFSKETGIDIE